MDTPLGPLITISLFVLEVLLVKPLVFEMYVDTWHGFFLGFIAFFLGFLFVYCGKNFWKTVGKWKWMYLGMALVLYLIRLMVYHSKAPNYLVAIESNLWIFGFLGLGNCYLNKGSSVLSYLSQAAYPVYIIHMFALYLGSLLILPLEIAVELKLLLLIIFTIALCYTLYEFVIRRVKVLRPLFGLKP